jgi:hypothetical protein
VLLEGVDLLLPDLEREPVEVLRPADLAGFDVLAMIILFLIMVIDSPW